ncbi:MAG TPA: carboxypeptidase-like regulatory domain-containing protein, partial [Flavobacterium sp.]|nr:carboxypeptidase-like regulatory domain-containing protein [Flavobacterium sp.]
MKTKLKIFSLLFFFVTIANFAQTARIKGVILDENKLPVNDVNISAGNSNAKTNETGFYELTIPANQKTTVVFAHVTLKKTTVTVQLKPNEDYEFNFVMTSRAEQIGEITIVKSRNRVEGITNISPAVIAKI